MSQCNQHGAPAFVLVENRLLAVDMIATAQDNTGAMLDA
jgi:hypothetical protein